jgi:hypothetical protein
MKVSKFFAGCFHCKNNMQPVFMFVFENLIIECAIKQFNPTKAEICRLYTLIKIALFFLFDWYTDYGFTYHNY